MTAWPGRALRALLSSLLNDTDQGGDNSVCFWQHSEMQQHFDLKRTKHVCYLFVSDIMKYIADIDLILSEVQVFIDRSTKTAGKKTKADLSSKTSKDLYGLSGKVKRKIWHRI